MKATTKTCKPASLDARIFKLNVSQLLYQTRRLKALCFSICFTMLTLSGFAQYSLVGNAVSQGGGCYKLTSDAQGQVGAIWNRSKITLDSNFEVEGTMNFGTNDGYGADGIAFVFQPY